MAFNSEENLSTSRHIKEQLRNLAFVLVGAIVFAFLMSTLSAFVVSPSGPQYLAITIIIGISALIAYILYRVYVFAPFAVVQKDVWFK
jgi:CBS domain containing-hemolysin-like protein